MHSSMNTTAAGLEAVETIIVDLPTIRAHKLAMTVMHRQTLVLVRIRTADGLEGLGEAATIGGLSYGAESPEGIKLCIDRYLAPALLGRDTGSIHACMQILEAIAQDNRCAKCAIETALLDVQGKRLGVPVSTLLGGVVRPRLPVLWTLASGDTGTDIAEAEELLARRRHDTFKLKIGRRTVREDVAHVAAIKRALGDRARVTVDVNQAWCEADAAGAIASLEGAGVDLVEQPVARDNIDGMARLAQRFALPIMADEAVHTPADAMMLAKRGAADVLALKIAKSGGLFNVARTAAVGDAAGMALYAGTMLEGSIGTIASAHVFATLPRLAWGSELFGPLLLKDDIVTERPEYGDFSLKVPSGPGLGVELDEDKLCHYRRRD